jgi:hypothetical protein
MVRPINQCFGVQRLPKRERQRVLPQSSRPDRPDRSAGRSRLSAAYEALRFLDNKRFDLAFKAIDELYCHANSNDVAKASHDIQNIRMR